MKRIVALVCMMAMAVSAVGQNDSSPDSTNKDVAIGIELGGKTLRVAARSSGVAKNVPIAQEEAVRIAERFAKNRIISSEDVKIIKEAISSEFADCDVNDVVLTLPQDLHVDSKREIASAFERNGIRILRIVNRTAAYAFDFMASNPSFDGDVLVEDFGDGQKEVMAANVGDGVCEIYWVSRTHGSVNAGSATKLEIDENGSRVVNGAALLADCIKGGSRENLLLDITGREIVLCDENGNSLKLLDSDKTIPAIKSITIPKDFHGNKFLCWRDGSGYTQEAVWMNKPIYFEQSDSDREITLTVGVNKNLDICWVGPQSRYAYSVDYISGQTKTSEWVAGIPKPDSPHVVSGETPDTYVPEEGWAFVIDEPGKYFVRPANAENAVIPFGDEDIVIKPLDGFWTPEPGSEDAQALEIDAKRQVYYKFYGQWFGYDKVAQKVYTGGVWVYKPLVGKPMSLSRFSTICHEIKNRFNRPSSEMVKEVQDGLEKGSKAAGTNLTFKVEDFAIYDPYIEDTSRMAWCLVRKDLENVEGNLTRYYVVNVISLVWIRGCAINLCLSCNADDEDDVEATMLKSKELMLYWLRRIALDYSIDNIEADNERVLENENAVLSYQESEKKRIGEGVKTIFIGLLVLFIASKCRRTIKKRSNTVVEHNPVVNKEPAKVNIVGILIGLVVFYIIKALLSK